LRRHSQLTACSPWTASLISRGSPTPRSYRALGPFEHCQLALAEHLLQLKNGTKTQDVQSSADFAIQWLLEELKLDSAADTAI
jgi:hypothetical protein